MKQTVILKNKLFLYLTEFFAGMSVMAVELGASRLLAPYFSSSQIVWTIVIGTIMIAMALACRPKLLIADEPTTALDVTIQAQILKLMNELREKNGTAVLFITHDLGVINQMADNVAVMYCGQVVEYAPAETICHKSVYSHPYTEGLMLSIPRLDTPSDERLEAIPGAVPHPLDLPKGCKFAPRCKYATERCLEEEPELIHVSDTQQVRCFYAKKEDRYAK